MHALHIAPNNANKSTINLFGFPEQELLSALIGIVMTNTYM